MRLLSFLSVAAVCAGGLLLSGCAMQRAVDAESAQKKMLGMSKEEIFTCMGIPRRKASEGTTEIWAYKSGNGWTTKDSSVASSTLYNSLKTTFELGNETKERRFCTVQIVMNDDRVQAVHYNGPTGGFLTEDEQCAYAVRNCIKPD